MVQQYSIRHAKNILCDHSCLVHCRVVDDFIGNVYFSVGILLACLIRHLHCPFHAPTIPICFCELHLDILHPTSFLVL